MIYIQQNKGHKMKITYMNSNTDLLIGLDATSLRVFITLMELNKYNLIDMVKIENKLLSKTGIAKKTLNNAITVLVKNKLLIRSSVSRVLFIDPSICVCGNERRVMDLYLLVSNMENPLCKLDEIENKEREESIEKALKTRWDNKRKIQEEFSEEETEVYLDGLNT